MKYRTDFVTNSSSTSFAVAAFSTLAGILAACNCTDSGGTEDPNQPGEEETGNEVFFQKTVMPEGAAKLVQGGDPVYLYAQLVSNTDKGVVVMTEALPSIRFLIKSGSGWVQLNPADAPEISGDWAAVEVRGVAPAAGGAPPETVSLQARCKLDKKTYTTTFNLAYEAEPALTIKPAKCDFLAKSGEAFEFAVQVVNPGAETWELNLEADSWADKICSNILTDDSLTGDKAKLVVTENDTEAIAGDSSDHYSKGRLTVRGNNGSKEVSDYCDVYVWREGLFRDSTLDMDRSTGDILITADKGADGEMIPAIFDLRYMRWEPESKTLKADTTIFSSEMFSFEDPDPSDDNAEAVFDTCKAVFKFEGERASNTPSGKFSVKMDKIIPGQAGERFRFKVTAVVDDDLDTFQVDIPFAIVPASLTEGHAEWQKEYDYCKKIITEFFPEDKRGPKLAELEDCKHYMGTYDLQDYRRDCWNIAQDIIMKKHDDYMKDAAWYDKAVYTAEWVQWLNDRAFNVVAGALTGPLGVIVVTQGKELIQDCIEKLITVKATDSWTDIAWDIITKRAQSTVGGAVDAKYFSEPEVSYKFIISFYAYKWVWHWVFDEENGARKGCLEGFKAAGWDLMGAGLEEKLKPFIGEMATRGGFNQSMAMDEYIKKSASSVKAFIDAINGGGPVIHITT
ncbi:MAG: hypothetical protein NTV45_02925 [Firmicutes bacterium]|nr:hypothetical protein [Bacillota bacterium]